MKNQKLTVRGAKVADVYKDIVRIAIKVRGEDFQESKIYWLTGNGKKRLVSIRGMLDQTDRSDSDICLDEKTRVQFGVERGEEYVFSLSKPVSQIGALVRWSLTSSDPLQRIAALWGLTSFGFGAIGLVFAVLGFCGVTLNAPPDCPKDTVQAHLPKHQPVPIDK